MGIFSSSQIFFLAIGVFLGAYLRDKAFRVKLHTMIDKYIFKKDKLPTKSHQEPNQKNKKTIIIDGKKYSEDNSQDDE